MISVSDFVMIPCAFRIPYLVLPCEGRLGRLDSPSILGDTARLQLKQGN